MVAHFDQRSVKLVCLTDTYTTMMVERRTLGEDISLAGSALGLCFLAFASEDPVEDIIYATRTHGPRGELERVNNMRRLEELIAFSQAQGHVIYEQPDRTAIAAPILHSGRVVGAIGVRMPLPVEMLASNLTETCAAVHEAAVEISDKFI
jgi:DNA-binding IclR family transcriptional regulator